MSVDLHILAFSGSLRRMSWNTRLLHVAKGLLPVDMTMEIFDLAPIPLYNEDLRQQGYPAPVAELRAKVRDADALLIACPEYNYSISGVLKNAIDWLSRIELDEPMGAHSPLWEKPTGIVGVGGRYSSKAAQIDLRTLASSLNMYTVNKPEVYISNFPYIAFNEDGDLTDEASKSFLTAHLAALRTLTLQLKMPTPA